MSERHHCAWCGSKLAHDSEHPVSTLCPECDTTYEAETHRSLHPVEEREPYND